VAEIGAITSLLTAAGNGLLRRFDADDAHDADGYATAAAWLAAKTHLGRKDAKAAVRQMRLLGSSPAPKRFFESHQAAARRLAGVLDSAAGDYVALHPGSCLDVSNDFDVILWEVPAATIRRPDLALHNCAPDDVRPLPASYIRVIVEVVSPGSDKTDRVEKNGRVCQCGHPLLLAGVDHRQPGGINRRPRTRSRAGGISAAADSRARR
jgi:hypothetical protein